MNSALADFQMDYGKHYAQILRIILLLHPYCLIVCHPATAFRTIIRIQMQSMTYRQRILLNSPIAEILYPDVR